MPWCPKCKTEYQEGFTVCSDCNTTLVENLEELENADTLEPFFQSQDKKIAEKLVKFLEYSDLKCELSYDDKNELYIVAVPPKKEKQAKKLFEAFSFVEAGRMQKESNSKSVISQENSEESEEGEEDFSSETNETEEYQDMIPEADSSPEDDEFANENPDDDITGYERANEDVVYVMKADEYKDLTGSVWIFLIFGVGGLLFVILNVTGILSIFSGWISNLVMGALFLSFIYIAFSTNKKAKKIQSEIAAENELTEKVNQWLKLNVTESFLASIHDDSISEELNYIKTTDEIKEMLIQEFGTQNLAYLDRLIDEYYNNTFDYAKE